MTHLVFVDTETTGLYPEKGHEVWEIALIVQGHRNPNVDGEYLFQVNPVDLSQADPYALKLSGYYERNKAVYFTGDPVDVHVETAPLEGLISESDVYSARRKAVTDKYQLAKFISFLVRGSHLVGAVPDFDVRFLKKFCEYYGERFDPHYHLIDVEALAVGYLSARLKFGVFPQVLPGAKDPRTKIREGLTLPYSSDTLSELVGVTPPTEDERHTALGDARWAKRLYEAIVEQPEEA